MYISKCKIKLQGSRLFNLYSYLNHIQREKERRVESRKGKQILYVKFVTSTKCGRQAGCSVAIIILTVILQRFLSVQIVCGL